MPAPRAVDVEATRDGETTGGGTFLSHDPRKWHIRDVRSTPARGRETSPSVGVILLVFVVLTYVCEDRVCFIMWIGFRV